LREIVQIEDKKYDSNENGSVRRASLDFNDNPSEFNIYITENQMANGSGKPVICSPIVFGSTKRESLTNNLNISFTDF